MPPLPVSRLTVDHYLGMFRAGIVTEDFCDQVVKKSIYAQAGIPCYWLVNLIDRRIEEYTKPVVSGENADYRQRRDYSADAEIALLLDGHHVANIPVRDLLP